jgi:uncharacterized protein YndB with AHSA1/START domain
MTMKRVRNDKIAHGRSSSKGTILTILLVLGVLVILLAILLGYAATKPSSFSVVRTTCVKAPPEQIFGLINDLRNWTSWSPFEKLDPTMKKTYSGAANGKGAVYHWESKGRAGEGRMEITESSTPTRIAMNLDFVKPMEGHNVVEFTLHPDAECTSVTWAMHGPSPYIAKVMGLFVSIESMVGKEFETGLADLKIAAERAEN